jgi:hypothetical protein
MDPSPPVGVSVCHEHPITPSNLKKDRGNSFAEHMPSLRTIIEAGVDRNATCLFTLKPVMLLCFTKLCFTSVIDKFIFALYTDCTLNDKRYAFLLRGRFTVHEVILNP